MQAEKKKLRLTHCLALCWVIGGGLAASTALTASAAEAVKKVKKAPVPGVVASPMESEAAARTRIAEEGFDGRDVYQILLAEIALKRGELDVAAQAYADVAQRAGDDSLFGRAVQVAVSAQQYDLALDIGRRWVAALPQSAGGRHALVSLLSGTRQGGEMVPHLERLLALDVDARPRNILHLPRLFAGSDAEASLVTVRTLLAPYKDLPESLFVEATFARAAGQPDQALRLVREALQRRPAWPVATYLDAQLQTSAVEAIAVWSRFIETTKDFEQAYVQRGRLYIGEKKYAEGRADFEAALALNKGSVDHLYALGILALQFNNRAAAEGYFKQLDGRDFGGKGLVDYQLGLLAQERGDIEAAVKYFSAVGKGEYLVMARTQTALILSRQGRIEEARAMLAGMDVVTAADRARLAIAQSQVLREAKQYEAALDVLENALTAQPNEPDLLYDKAMLAERLKKVDVLESTLVRLIELRPNHPHAYNALGYSWAERNVRLEEARKLIAKALELAPQDPFILDSMGWVMFRLGQPKAALVNLEEAYRQRPDPEIAAHMGEVLWSLGRRGEAQKIWREARKQFPDNEVLGAVIERFKP